MFTIQESQYKKNGKFAIENFEIFESIRKKEKGGTIIGVHKSLNQVIETDGCTNAYSWKTQSDIICQPNNYVGNWKYIIKILFITKT